MVTLMRGVLHVEVRISARFAGGGVRFHCIHSCIFNTTVVVVVDCHIYSWFLPITSFNILMSEKNIEKLQL